MKTSNFSKNRYYEMGENQKLEKGIWEIEKKIEAKDFLKGEIDSPLS